MAAGRPLAPRPLGPTPYNARVPQTAWAGGRYLTVWYESAGQIGSTLFGAFSDANGTRVSPRPFPIATRWSPAWYELVGTGDSFVLFEQDLHGTRMEEIDAQGRITAARTLALPEGSDAQIVWNGTHFLAAVQSDGFSKLLLFDRDGRIAFTPATLPTYNSRLDIAPAGDRFVVAASGDLGLFAHQVTPEGIGPRVMIRTPGHFVSDPRPGRVLTVPLGNGDALVIWSSVAEQSSELLSVVVRRDGTLGAESVLTSHTTPLTPLEAVRSGNGFVLTYAGDRGVTETDHLWTLRLDDAGRRAGDPVLVESGVAGNGGSYSVAAGTATTLVTYVGVDYSIRSIAAGDAASAPELLSIREAHQAQPILGAGNGGVLAVWDERSGAGSAVRAASVDADGRPRAAVQVAPQFLLSRETAWNGTHHLVVHGGQNRLLATRVTATGAVAGATPIVLADPVDTSYPRAAVAWAGTRWVVVWTDGARLYSMTVSGAGVPSAARELDILLPIPEHWVRGVEIPVLSFDGEHVLLVWSEWQMEECFQFCIRAVDTTFAVRLTPAGDPVDSVPVDLGLENPRSLSAASSGSEFFVAADEYAAILQSGSMSLRMVMTPRELFDFDALSDVTWDGTHYVVALRYYGWVTDSYLARLRLDRNGNDASARLGTPTLQPDSQDLPPSIAAPSAGNALIGVHEGTAVEGVSAVVYRERDLAPLPAPPLPPRNVQVTLVAPNSYEVSWDPPADGAPDAYIVQQLIGNEWSHPFRVRGDITRLQLPAFVDLPVFRVRAVDFGGASAGADSRSGRPRRRSVR